MTAMKEDYLKAIYQLGGMETVVTNKAISEALGVAPASVSEMLAKLQRDELIEYQPYKGSQLTSKGQQLAIALVRRHRLWEVFLITHLGYPWSEAHEDAELLEHATPARLTARLDQFLNNPATCPHGHLIPSASGEMDQRLLQPLSDLAIGEQSVIRAVIEESELLDYLQAQGVMIGEAVELIERGAYEGPLTVKQQAQSIELSYKAAQQIFVDIPE